MTDKTLLVHRRRRSPRSRCRGQVPLWVAVVMGIIVLAGVIVFSMDPGAGSAGGRKQIVIWNAARLGEDLQSALHQFEVENPQYQVTASTAVSPDITGDGQRLLCAIAGGVPPDVVAFDRFAVGEWAGREALTNLTPLLEQQRKDDPYRINLGDYYPWAIAEASYRKVGSNEPAQIYGIPTDVDIRLLFCNADQLRQEGIVDPLTHQPRPPRTWSELRQYASRLTRRNASGAMTRLGFAPNFGNSWLYLYAFQAGGELLSADGTRVQLDSPPVQRALRFMVDVYDDLGGVYSVDGFQAGFQADALDPFLSGKVSMKIDGDWCLHTIADWKRDMDFTTSPAPMPDDRAAAGVPPVTWAGGYSLVIPSTAKEKEGAFKLIQFLLSHKTYRFLQQSAREAREADGRLFLPVGSANRKFFEEIEKEAVEDNPHMPPAIKRAYAVLRDMLPNTRIRPVSPVGQLLWNQHIRAYEAATHHQFQQVARDKDEEIHLSLAAMQVDVQRQLDAIISPLPPHQVYWIHYFLLYFALLAGMAVMMFITYRRRRKSHGYKAAEVGASLVFVSPWLLGMICLVGGPVLFSIILSVTRYDVLSSARYVGMVNYRDILTDPVFFKSLGNTAFMVLRIPLLMAASLGIALILNRKAAGIGVYRTAFFMPSIVPVVAASLLWIFLLSPNFGAVNVVLSWVFSTFPFRGLEWCVNHVCRFRAGPFHFTPPIWLQDPAWSKPSLILMSLWGAGGGMIIWLAGLQSIPRQLYEAAAIDGAGRWRQFINVTLPMLSPYILFNAVTGLIGTMQIFSEAFIMTSGGPADSTLFYAYYLFREAFQYFRMGYASALAWILFVLVLMLTMLQLWLSRR
jgi:ABC-type sugar transport system permease subunit/ABC-type glycerol-3-phosphate transport system substrate-binding protein